MSSLIYKSLPQMMRPVSALLNHGPSGHFTSYPGHGFDGQQNYDQLYTSGLSWPAQPQQIIPITTDSSRSFTVSFTRVEEKCVLKRMIKMHMISDRSIKELSPCHVQQLNTMFANSKKRLDCFHETIGTKEMHDTNISLRQEAKHDEIIVESNVLSEEELVQEAGLTKTVAWSDLNDTTKQRRLKAATRELREKFLPFLRECINPLDEEGALLNDNFIMSELLRYGVRDANKKNRISPTLSFPDMLPHSVVNAISVLAKGEQEAEERREMRVEALPDWLVVYQRSGAEVYRILRRILPDRMLPSMYQLDNYKETLAQAYGHAISWRRTYSGFQIKAAEFLPVFILSNLMRYVSGYDTGLLDDIRIVLKCLVDGFHMHKLNCVHALAFHMNLILLPLNTDLAMTDFYPTDKEMRARNPAGQRGISTATMGLALGQETWANLRANFAHYDPTAEHNPRKIKENVIAGCYTVDILRQICDLFSITKNGKKAQGTKPELSESILAYLEVNEPLFDTELFSPLEEHEPHVGPGERDSKTDLMLKVPDNEMLLPFMAGIRGASFTAHIPMGTRSQDKADTLRIQTGSDGKALFKTVTGRLDNSYNVDMKCLKASLGFGTSPCPPTCLSRAFVADHAAAPSSTNMPKRRKRCDKQPPPACGKICPACDVTAHNHYRYLSFLGLAEIKEQMHWKEGSAPLTLGCVAKFYKMSVGQVIRFSTAAFSPGSCATAAAGAGCNCKWVQRGMFGYSGHDITSPREEKSIEDPAVFRCSAGNTAHESQRLYNYVCMWETVANVPTLGLWGLPADFSADTDLDSLTCKTLDGFPESRVEVILGLRHLWVEQINAPRPLHDSLRDPRLHVCGQLHGPYLGLTRWIVSLMIKIADSRNMLGAFNRQHSQVLSVTKDEKNQLPEQNFHGPKARKIVTWYASFIDYDPINDVYTVNDNARWPLRGIVDDGPNLQHILAAFFHLKREHVLAWDLFLTPEGLSELFSTTLEVSIRFRALVIFGFYGFPHYAHYHLHGPRQLWQANFQGYRAAAEDVGEASHCSINKRAERTVGGAMGRGRKKVNPDCDDAGVMLQRGVCILENKSQRLVSGDSHVLFQVARAEQLGHMIQHMPALEWQHRFETENPGQKAFVIDLSNKQACGLPPGPPILSMRVIVPYDVIDRIGLRVQVQGAIGGAEAASMAEGERIMENGVPHQTPPCSPRLGSAEEDRHPGHPGSNNPALRKKNRPTDSQCQQDLQPETGAAGIPAPKRGGRAGNAGRAKGPKKLFGT